MSGQGPLFITSFIPWTDETRPDRWGGSAETRERAKKRRLKLERELEREGKERSGARRLPRSD